MAYDTGVPIPFPQTPIPLMFFEVPLGLFDIIDTFLSKYNDYISGCQKRRVFVR